MSQYAIIDIGSNTIRLNILDELKFCSEKLISKKLPFNFKNEINLENLVSIFKYYKSLLEQYKITKLDIIATASLRESPSQEFIKQQISNIFNQKVEILSAEQEASYTCLAVKNSLQLDNGLIIDFGGGSTELINFNNSNIDITCIKLGIRDLENLTAKQINQYLSDNLNFAQITQNHIIANSGLFRNICRMYIDYINYPINIIHGFKVKIANILKFLRIASKFSADELISEIGYLPKKNSYLRVGYEFFKLVSQYNKNTEITFVEYGLRDGFIQEKYQLQYDYQQFAEFYNLSNYVQDVDILLNLLKTAEIKLLDNIHLQQNLFIFLNCANRINKNKRAEYAFEFIISSNLPFTHEYLAIIATIIAISHCTNLELPILKKIRKTMGPNLWHEIITIGLILRYYRVLKGTNIQAFNKILEYCKEQKCFLEIKDNDLDGKNFQKILDLLNNNYSLAITN